MAFTVSLITEKMLVNGSRDKTDQIVVYTGFKAISFMPIS